MKNKKRISIKDWTYIGKCNYAVKWLRPLCSYTLIKQDEKTFIRDQKANLFVYLLIFIPIHFLQLFICMWDGGLREFTILKRAIGKDYIKVGDYAFERAAQIWNGKKISNSKD